MHGPASFVALGSPGVSAQFLLLFMLQEHVVKFSGDYSARCSRTTAADPTIIFTKVSSSSSVRFACSWWKTRPTAAPGLHLIHTSFDIEPDERATWLSICSYYYLRT
ncbi:hypothetical protein BDR05DRAFT_970147 [Suillus weaverae]|nr:hypothetical protein BDR05DRAFT_970147 [Suillus weaverae]